MSYMEVSAKTGHNVNELFAHAAEIVANHIDRRVLTSANDNDINFIVDTVPSLVTKKKTLQGKIEGGMLYFYEENVGKM